jgi:hypothetical protein
LPGIFNHYQRRRRRRFNPLDRSGQLLFVRAHENRYAEAQYKQYLRALLAGLGLWRQFLDKQSIGFFIRGGRAL